MNNLDLSKLRFRIGDTVLYQGFECKFWRITFMKCVLDILLMCMIFANVHTMVLDIPLTKMATALIRNAIHAYMWQTVGLNQLISKSMETKEDHPLIKGLKEYLSKTSPEQFEKDWSEIQKRFGRFDGTSEEYEEYMRGCFDMIDIPTSAILENSLFPEYVKDKISFIGKEIIFFLNKQYIDAILLGFSVDNEDYYYRVDVNGAIGYIPLSIVVELKIK